MSFTAIISANIKDFEQGIDKAKKSIDGLEKSVSSKLANIGSSFIDIGKKASILSAGIIAAGGAAFKMAADFEDALGATDQIYRGSSDAVKNWADNLSTSFGIAKDEALEYSNLMGSMLINIGQLTEEQAQKQSAKLIELAGDLTAMYGGTTQDAVRALTGALKGNNTMLDNYGMAVNDALVKQKALELGLSKGTGELSLQAKQAATLALIYEQTGAAQGQAAREADGASGSMRELATSVKNLSTSFGEVLLPVITPIITKLSEMVQGLNDLDPAMKRTIVTIAGITAAVGPLLLGLGSIIKLLPIIKVGLVALTGPVGAIIAAAVAGIALIIANWDMLKGSIRKDLDFLKDRFAITGDAAGKLFSGNFKGWWDSVKQGFDADIDYLKRRWSEFKELFRGGGELDASAGRAIGGLATAIEEVATVSDVAVESIKEFGKAFEDTRNTFDKFIASTSSINEAVVVTTQTIANLKQRILDLQTGKLFSDDITGEIQEYTNLIKEFETGLDTLTRGTWNVDFTINNKLPEESKFVLPEVDATGMMASLQRANEMIINMGDLIGSGVQGIAQSIGQALGEGNFSDLGKGLMSALGRLAQQFGGMLISFGTASLALKKLIVDPFTAIAVGAGLVALGAAATASANKMMNSATSGGYTGGTSSYQTAPAYGPSEYRGSYMDDWSGRVVFEIGNDKLVGTLQNANNKSSRLG